MTIETLVPHPIADRAFEVLRGAGNPFRNYFARNPDDEFCARYHVSELYAREREQLLGVVELYRADPGTHSEIVPVLGNKGAGKTHLLHSIKHGRDGGWQLLVTPGTFQKDTDFLEYLLFQVIDTLLGGGTQKGVRPLEYVSEERTCRLLAAALNGLTSQERLDLFPAPGLGRWTRKLGLGTSQAQERVQWLLDQLSAADFRSPLTRPRAPRQASETPSTTPCQTALARLCEEASLSAEQAFQLVSSFIERTEPHNTAGLMRRHILQGFARAALIGAENELANFLTFGFAELEFHVRPSRQDLVLALFKVLMEIFLHLKTPVVVAFDQLEDLLLARRSDDAHRVAETFFAGIVQAMHQIPGVCFLVFAERGLWNRFVPSLDGYIQDRLNNPIHLPGHGTIKALRLEAPDPELVRRVVEARLRPTLACLSAADAAELPALFPFTTEQVQRIAKTEPTLRDMLQQFRHLFDFTVYGEAAPSLVEPIEPSTRLASTEAAIIKSVVVIETPATSAKVEAHDAALVAAPIAITRSRAGSELAVQLGELWEQDLRSARRQLEPEGALTGATRELQAGLGSFLQVCYEHGVKVGPWRLQHVVGELTFGEHPTYGVVTIAHWVCKDGQPWKVGIGLFLGRGAGKPKDLETKLAALDTEPPLIDHLILLRPEDDLVLSGKSKTLWQHAERRGRHARLEACGLDTFAALYSFPRWLTSATEIVPSGQPLPNLADLLQDKGERLLHHVCMPVQGG